MKKISIAILILFFVSAVPQVLSAEEISKIGFINVTKVFDDYKKTEDAEQRLKAEGEKKNSEREKLVNKINKLRDEVELLSVETREKKQKDLNDMMRQLQDFDRDVKTDLRRKRDDDMREILKEIYEVINDYGAKNGYDIIFDDRVLIYADDAIDITDEVLNVLNKK